MDVAGASTYTVAYSDSTNKFTLTSDGLGGGGIFTLFWNTGANSATSVGSTIGFDVSADDSGALAYTADYLRIHSEEWLKNNLGSAQDVKAFVFKKHNLSNTAIAKIQGHTADAWGAPAVDVSLTITADITIYFWSTAQTYQWWRYYLQDVDNSDGYVETGRIFLGDYFSPSVNFRCDYRKGLIDPSNVLFSDGGQISSNLKTKYKTYALVFEYASDTDLSSFESLWDELGLNKDFFFVRDRDNAANTAHYARIADNIMVQHIVRDELYIVTILLEELR